MPTTRQWADSMKTDTDCIARKKAIAYVGYRMRADVKTGGHDDIIQVIRNGRGRLATEKTTISIPDQD
ncbi:MAG: hypothetical protein ABSB22_04280 [Thermodesulfobacteriota bacterium]